MMPDVTYRIKSNNWVRLSSVIEYNRTFTKKMDQSNAIERSNEFDWAQSSSISMIGFRLDSI